jgi:hypothetical protein
LHYAFHILQFAFCVPIVSGLPPFQIYYLFQQTTFWPGPFKNPFKQVLRANANPSNFDPVFSELTQSLFQILKADQLSAKISYQQNLQA